MKKTINVIIFVFMAVLLFTNNANAAIVSLHTDGEFQEYINKTGFKLLNSNAIERHIVFRYVNSDSLKTYSSSEEKAVYIPRGILTYIESEDELAAIIAYQTAYCLQYYEGAFSKITLKISPKKYEAYADKRAVDFLVKAGYSPIALITVIQKVDGQTSNHEKTSVRLARIYEFIVRKYPDKTQDRKFKNNIYYQNFLLNSRKNREILHENMRNNPFSTQKTEYR